MRSELVQGEPWTSLEGDLCISGEQQRALATATERLCDRGGQPDPFLMATEQFRCADAAKSGPHADDAEASRGTSSAYCKLCRRYGAEHYQSAGRRWRVRGNFHRRCNPAKDPTEDIECSDDEFECTVVEENRSTINDIAPGDLFARLPRYEGDMRCLLTGYGEAICFSVPQDCTPSFVGRVLSELGLEAPLGYALRFDLYLPQISSWKDARYIPEDLVHLPYSKFLKRGECITVRVSFGLEGGAKKKAVKRVKVRIPGKKRKNPSPKVMGKRQPNQNSLTNAMFAVRIPKPPRISRARLPPRIEGALTMSECSRKFLEAVVDPFSARNVCLPTHPAQATLKASGFVRFNMALGTAFYGFVTGTPTWASDMPQGYVSTNAYTSTSCYPLSSTNTLRSGVTRFYASNLPYGTGSVLAASGYSALPSSSLLGRVVGAGLRISYVGTTINESGVSYCYVDPMHSNALAATADGGNAGSLLFTSVEGVSRSPCHMSIYPISDVECSFSNMMPDQSSLDNGSQLSTAFSNLGFSSGDNIPISAVATANDTINTGSNVVPQWRVPGPIYIFQVQASAAASYLVEYIIHVEYSGPYVATLATPNAADPQGLAHCVNILQQVPIVRQRAPHLSLKETVLSAVREIAAGLKPVAVSAVIKGLSAMML